MKDRHRPGQRANGWHADELCVPSALHNVAKGGWRKPSAKVARRGGRRAGSSKTARLRPLDSHSDNFSQQLCPFTDFPETEED